MTALPQPEPLSPADARKLMRSIVADGDVEFSGHAMEEMARDHLATTDCVNVLRGGVVQPGELEKGTYRYRVETQRMAVVVAFRSTTKLRVVTAWRK